MTPEERRALEVELEARRRGLVGGGTDDVGIAENVGRGAAKGAVQMLGFPAEAALAVPKAGAFLGGDQESLDYLMTLEPTKALESVLNSVGISTTPETDSFRERMAANTAEAVTGGLVGIGAGGMARGVIKKATDRLMQGRLGRFAAEDAAAATVGAGARTLAQEAGFDDPAAGISEFAASFLTGGMIDKIRLSAQAKRALGNVGDDFRAKERNKAAQFVQQPILDAGENPRDVAANIRQGDENLTAGAASRSTALIQLENALIKSDPALQAKFIESKKNLDQFVNDELREALGADGIPEDFISNYRQSSEWAIHLTELNRQKAMEEMAAQIRELPPVGVDYSSPVKSKLEELKRIDREIEKDLWSQTGAEDVFTSSMNPERPFIKEAFDDLRKEAKRAGRAVGVVSMPDKNIMGAIKEIAEGETATVDELLALRSSLLDSASEASVNQNTNLARRLNKLADATLNTIEGASGENAEIIQQARQFSRDLNDRYTRDVIGPILSQSARRGELVPANQTMERVFAAGERGRTNIRALATAAGEVPKEAKNYMLQQFYQNAISDDAVNVNRAESFIRRYRPALEEAGLLDTVSAYVVTGRAANESQKALADLVSGQGAEKAAQFLRNYGATGDDLKNFLATTLKSEAKDAQGTMRQLYQEALTDVSGDALRGLQSATADAVLKAIYTASGDATTMLPDISTRIVNALGATGNFSEAQIDRVQTVMETLWEQSSAEKLRAFKGSSNTPQDLANISMLKNLARFIGLTKIAPMVKGSGPGSLAAASTIGRAMEGVVDAVTKDDAESLVKAAIFDKDLMAALMESPTNMSPKNKGIIRRALKMIRRVGAGGLTPSQTTIVNELEQEEDGR